MPVCFLCFILTAKGSAPKAFQKRLVVMVLIGLDTAKGQQHIFHDSPLPTKHLQHIIKKYCLSFIYRVRPTTMACSQPRQ